LRRIVFPILIIGILYPFFTGAFCFDEAAREYGLNASILRGIAYVESNNNPDAMNYNRNGTTDLGIMQINSSWIKPMGLNKEELIKNPCYNIKTAARIVRKCMDKHGYTWEAIGCYNALNQNGRVKYSWKVFHELNRTDHSARNPFPSMASNSFLYFKVHDNEQSE